MAKVPLSAKKEIPRKCPICEKKFKSKEYLVAHIERVHKNQIPEDWSASRYENYLRTNKDHGSCIVCKENTEWNESTWKYNRICNNKKCHNEVAKKAKKNMIGKYGKVHLLNDPEMQRKMIYAKHTSGTYIWSTDTKKEYPQHYASQVEKSFLEMLDAFLNLDPSDVESPSPHTYIYKYEGKEHQYIPDHYIRSLNLEIEIKEPKNNQNMHPKIQAVDKVKETLKDELMESINEINYIKINGTDYSKFFALFTKLKNLDDDTKVIDSITQKSLSKLSELTDNFMSDYDRLMAKTDEVKTAIELATNKKQGFKSILDTLDKRLFKVETIRDCLDLKSYCIALKKRFAKYLTVEDGEHRLKFEAGKAINYIDDIILPRLDVKMESLRRRGITEGINFYAEKRGRKFRPVFIILTYGGALINKITRFGTKQQWTHASIALDTELHNNITFGDKRKGEGKMLGFKDNEDTREQYKRPVSKYAVYLYMATQQEYDIICDVVDEFKRNEDSYRFDSFMLLKVWRQKGSDCIDNFVCSTFVAYVLGEANPRLLDKHFSLYSPGDLAENRNFTLISQGSVSAYDPKLTDRLLTEKIRELGYTNFKYDTYNEESIEIVDDIAPINEATVITCKMDEEEYIPVFIVVSMNHDIPNSIEGTGEKRSFHASIALDTSLKHNITFGPKPTLGKDGCREYGFSYDENIMDVHKGNKAAYVIFMYMAHIREISTLKDILGDLRSRSNVVRYSIKNVLNLLKGRDTVNTEEFKYSTFIGYILNEMNPNLLSKHYSLMTPDDVMHIRGLTKVDSGLVKRFDEEKFDQKVMKLIKRRGFVDVQLKYEESEEDHI